MRSKSICVVNDLTIDEQRHLYKVADNLRKQLNEGNFPVHDKMNCSYLMFLEDSTRTKESFRNASEALKFRTNMFDSSNSSLNKFETLNDTVRMLCGYTSMQSVFIIRSKIEGLCKSLSDSMREYAARAGIAVPAFVNAGDGKHEHPTQEFLDEFSFLQQLKGNTDRIHIALVGDLLLGRTIHSKADGLRIFKEVTVDLVAPADLQLPADYSAKMRANGFHLNVFGSLDEYLQNPARVASILYFTRLQLERMDKSMLEKETILRSATTLRMDMLSKLPKGAKIYHPLPRHGEMPEIPFEVDKTEFNGYDEQSRNGYFVRTALLGLITGVFEDLPSSDCVARLKHEQQIPGLADACPCEEVNPFFALASKASSESTAWVEVEFPIGTNPAMVRKAISRMRVLTDIETKDGFCQITGNRGYHTIPIGHLENDSFLKLFASFFKGCKPVVVFESSKGVFKKISFEAASLVSIKNLPGLGCPNTACVSHPESRQRDVETTFEPSRVNPAKFTCRYCEREVSGIEMFQRMI